MTIDSLQSVINAMAGAPAVPAMNEAFVPVDAWTDSLESDPLLASLHKHYQDARLHYQDTLRAHGPYDPLCAVALDMMESQRSAFETRLIEVKKDRRRQRSDSQRDIMDRLDAAQAEASAREREIQHTFHNRRTRDLARQKAEKEGRDGLFTAWVLVWLLNRTIRDTYERLKLASVFQAATIYEPQVKAV